MGVGKQAVGRDELHIPVRSLDFTVFFVLIIVFNYVNAVICV